jgi:hypothetical protein
VYEHMHEHMLIIFCVGCTRLRSASVFCTQRVRHPSPHPATAGGRSRRPHHSSCFDEKSGPSEAHKALASLPPAWPYHHITHPGRRGARVCPGRTSPQGSPPVRHHLGSRSVRLGYGPGYAGQDRRKTRPGGRYMKDSRTYRCCVDSWSSVKISDDRLAPLATHKGAWAGLKN